MALVLTPSLDGNGNVIITDNITLEIQGFTPTQWQAFAEEVTLLLPDEPIVELRGSVQTKCKTFATAADFNMHVERVLRELNAVDSAGK